LVGRESFVEQGGVADLLQRDKVKLEFLAPSNDTREFGMEGEADIQSARAHTRDGERRRRM
jgi:hypothetical protein